MLLTVLVALTGALLVTVYAAHRHAELRAWDRELAAAFCVDQRKEMTGRRVL